MPPRRHSSDSLVEEHRHDHRRTPKPRTASRPVQQRLGTRPAKQPDCRLCERDHPLRRCPKFVTMTVMDRRRVVRRHRYCQNCLAHSHLLPKCRSRARCNKCNIKHHTLLHHAEIVRANAYLTQADATSVVPTVIIRLKLGGEWRRVRGLLNPCATKSSIASFMVTRYHLPFERFDDEKWCQLAFRTRFEAEGGTFAVRAVVSEALPETPPKKQLDRSVAIPYRNLRLADPEFYESHPINFVLGADVYPTIIRSGLQTSTIGSPLGQDTVLGWVIIGRFAD